MRGVQDNSVDDLIYELYLHQNVHLSILQRIFNCPLIAVSIARQLLLLEVKEKGKMTLKEFDKFLKVYCCSS